MISAASPTQARDGSELDDTELDQVAGGTGNVLMDDDGCELPPGDLPHDQIPTPAPMPTPVDANWSGWTTTATTRH